MYKALLAAVATAVILVGFGGGIVAADAPTKTVNGSPSQTGPQNVIVKPGDSLSAIASNNGTTYIKLYDANSTISNPNLIFPGETIVIPTPGETLPNRPLPGSQSSSVSTTPAVSAAADTDDSASAPETTQPAPAATPAAVSSPAPAAAPAPTVSTDAAVSSTASSASSSSTPSNTGVWQELANCESGGNWSIDTGNGFYGGLQFTLSSWQAVGGTGYPNQASEAEQIAMAQKLQAVQGWGAWPVCSAKIGL